MSKPVISQDVLDSLLIPSTATLTAQLSSLGLWHTFMHEVSPLQTGTKMVGSAFTLRYIPAREDLDRVPLDNLTDIQRIGIEQIGPGEVLVIDARGDTRAGTMGNILATRVHRRGATGIVTDGAYRDSPAFLDIDIPSYARAMNAHTNKTIHHPADIQLPVGCGGVAVFPGDIVVGDDEGVVVIPRKYAEQVAERALEQEVKETFLLKKIEDGASIVGVYPPDEATNAEFETWKKNRK